MMIIFDDMLKERSFGDIFEGDLCKRWFFVKFDCNFEDC